MRKFRVAATSAVVRSGMAGFLIVGAVAFVSSSYALGASSAGAAPKTVHGQAEPVKPHKNVKPKKAKLKPNISSAMTALIDGDSVTTVDGLSDSSGAVSLEQYAAEQLGYTVTVVTGSQWDSMTAAQFSQYQLLIVGDPFCNETDPAATSNAATWAPVVMGTAGDGTTVGNRVVIGTDPEYHFIEGGGGATEQTSGVPTSAGAEHMVQDGLNFAGAITGATGVYFDTSCEDNGSDLATLDQLTTVPGGTFFDNGAGTTGGSVPCGGSVEQIASNSAFDSGPTVMTDADIQGWECSDHITFTTYPSDFDPLAVATDTPTTPTCGTDPDTGLEACGQAYILLAGRGVVVSAPNITLTPPSGSQLAGPAQTHTVTATVTTGTPPATTPVSGAVVSFSVAGQNSGASGTCTTSSMAADPTCATGTDGEVLFTYSDGNGAGDDTINGSVTLSGTTEEGSATWDWTTAGPLPTQLSTTLSGGGSTGGAVTVAPGTSVTDAATLSGTNAAEATGTVTYNVYSDSGCTTLVSGGSALPITTAGTLPGSAAESLTATGTYYWQAVYSGDTNNEGSTSPCGTEVETVATTSSPTCVLSGEITGPPKQIQVTVQAPAGLESVTVTEDVNDTVNVPSFTAGDTAPVVVTATKTNQSEGSELALMVTDTNGNQTSCDPADFSVTGGHAQMLTNLNSGEDLVTVTNSGLSRVVIYVDGTAKTIKLKAPDAITVVNLAKLFRLSSNNVVVKGFGKGSADVLFAT